MAILREKFIHTDNTGFNYHWKGEVKTGDTVILRFPPVTANKRGVNDIGWQIDGGARLFATASPNPAADDALWQEIHDYEDINKCASGVKIIGAGGVSKCLVRIILN